MKVIVSTETNSQLNSFLYDKFQNTGICVSLYKQTLDQFKEREREKESSKDQTT